MMKHTRWPGSEALGGIVPMTFKGALIRLLEHPGGRLFLRTWVRLLDRPGGRLLLGKLATRVARRVLDADVEIMYDALWTHRVGSYFFPDGPQFNYNLPFDFPYRWKEQKELYISAAEDFWFQHYRPQEGDVVIDIGAGCGEDTLAFSLAAGETGRVIAIEAHPLTFAILKHFCRLNRLVNTTPLQLALMDKPGMVSMIESDESLWETRSVEYGVESSGLQVRASTLDEVCEVEGLKDIAFVKMNIEGAERYALLGMKSVIRRIRRICVACHDFRADCGDGEQFRTRAFVEQFLIEHGFTLASRPDDPRNYVRDHIFGLRL
jgi:FkbM family methyltransferase